MKYLPRANNNNKIRLLLSKIRYWFVILDKFSTKYKIFSNVLHKPNNIIRKQMKKLVDFIIATSFKVIIQT